MAARSAEDFAVVARDSRLAMRRAGIFVRHHRGDPVILREGPLRLALPVAGLVMAAIGTALGAASIELHFGVDVAVSALGLSVVLGAVVRVLFGGVSQAAGLIAALACATAIAAGQWFTGGVRSTASPVAELSRLSDWVVAHQQAAVACYAVAILLAYVSASGRRVS